MKGRYSGSHMTIYGTILPHSAILARIAESADKLTNRARQRLKILDWHNNNQRNQSLTSRHFGIDRKTLRRWIRRYSSSGINALNDKSHRPINLRHPTTSSLVVTKIISIRKQYPAWSKYKIRAILSQDDILISSSTIGRVLKRFNLINNNLSIKRKRSSKITRLRFFKGLKISIPGDMIQIDTKYIVVTGGRRMYQFTAIDVLTKQRVLRVYSSQSSRNGKHFLDECISSYPYFIKAIQTDNGSEFMGEFDKYLKLLNITHYYTYPRHPKQNSYVENSHGSDEKEFYLQGNISSILDVMQRRMISWQNTWNNIRPHQSLNYLTPNQYYLKYKTSRLPTRDVITLQA